MNAWSLLQYELSLRSIPTGSRKLDEAMGNGIRFGTITEFAGRIETGVTQLVFQIMFNTILPKPLGAIDGEVVYISTRPESFCPERVYPMADHHVEIWRNKYGNTREAKMYTRDLALSKILYRHVNSLPDLIQSVFYLDKLVRRTPNNFRLIVIDSYSMLLRGLEPMEQIRIDYEMLSMLESIAVDDECAVILTNTMTPEITESLGNSSFTQMKPALGNSHHHRIHQRIVFTKDADRNIIAGVQKTVTEGPSVVALNVSKHGVTDAKF